MNRERIIVYLWPKGSPFEGQCVDKLDDLGRLTPTVFALLPADAELLIRDYLNTPNTHYQAVGRSIQAALREWREAIAAEDDERVPAPYADHVEKRIGETIQEEQPYG